jgi:hypothetical protein
MSNKIRAEVYRRFVLAKMLYKAGEASCASRNDHMAFTKGILLLHDAAEAVLGAIADHMNAKLTGNRYLLDYYDLIEAADSQKRKVPYSTQMRNLNTLRNNAKHQGILPDPKNNSHFPQTVYALISELCQTYLGLDFPSISLKSLIRKEKVLAHIDEAEHEIEGGKIEEALISLAYAIYWVCEASTIPWSFSLEEEKPIQFTEPYEIEHTVKLIENGIDPYLYFRFKNLTPLIGRKKDTGELVYWWDKLYGHPKNWTNRNASFCLDFCIETALKFQREEDEGYTLISYDEVYEDVIEPANEQATIWNKSTHPPKHLFGETSGPRTRVLTLEKDQSIIGTTKDHHETLDEWLVISEGIPHKSTEYVGFGFVLKSDVKITRREKETHK